MPTANEKFKECFDIFSNKAIDEEGTPNSCKIHDELPTKRWTFF